MAEIRYEKQSILDLLDARLATDPDGEYLDVCGDKITASQAAGTGGRLAGGLAELGVRQGDRVAIILENSLEAVVAWWGTILLGAVTAPVNTAFRGDYLIHQLNDSGAAVVIVHASLLDRVEAVLGRLEGVRHVVVVEGDAPVLPAVATHTWSAVLAAGPLSTRPDVRPTDLGSIVYTGGTTGRSKGCMLSHGFQLVNSYMLGTVWDRTASDVVNNSMPMFHMNSILTGVLGPLVFGGRSSIERRFSVSRFWEDVNRTGATIASTLGSMAYLLANDRDRPEMPRSGAPEANRTLRLMSAQPITAETNEIIRTRFGIETFVGGYGMTETGLISCVTGGRPNRPEASGVVNDALFEVRLVDDADDLLPPGSEGEIVVRPRRANVMFQGYWRREDATLDAFRNLWFHTGDIGRIDEDGYLYFRDRKSDYLRRRGENISSSQVESIIMAHEQLAEASVHSVPSPVMEDDLKVTAVLTDDATLTPAALFEWCIERLPYFALPRYIEFRKELPLSPVGRVLKRELRADGVTADTWDVETSGISYERR